EQRLSYDVIDLVSAGMVQILALQVDLRATELAGQPPGMVDRAGTSHIVLEVAGKLGEKLRIVAAALVGGLQLFERENKGFRDEDTAVLAEMARCVRQVIHPHCALPR